MTKENAKDFLPLVQALAEGKTIQLASGNHWYDVNPDFTCPPSKYRIKPDPKLRPWKPDEVPVGALYRACGQTEFKQMILGVSPSGIKTTASMEIGQNYKPDHMLREYEHSLDHGKTWLPCGVVEGES